MLPSTQNEVVLDAGVDWITVSSTGGNSSELLFEKGEELLREAITVGNQKKPWGMAGFHGYKAGSVQSGVRGGEVLVRLGSEMAHRYWREVYGPSDNCSRLDVQLTVRGKEDAQARIAKSFKAAKAHAAGRGKKSTLSVLSTNNGPSTIYFNKRVSDRFGRIYDKGAESNLAHYQGAVRYEVEFKNELAKRVVDKLDHADSVQNLCASLVIEFFEKRGVSLLIGSRGCGSPRDHREYEYSGKEFDGPCPGASDSDRQLAWLAKCVQGTVLNLCGSVGVDAVVKALGLDQVVQPVYNAPKLECFDTERIN